MWLSSFSVKKISEAYERFPSFQVLFFQGVSAIKFQLVMNSVIVCQLIGKRGECHAICIDKRIFNKHAL